MGGTEGARGYLYQGVISVIEALTISGWDKIYVEYPSEDDKIDIALENNKHIIKSIQVKSTIDSFSAPDMLRWIKAVVADKKAEQYQLILIGNCDKNAQTLKKSVDKYYNKKMDKEATDSIQQLGTSFLDTNKISFDVLPCDLDRLIDISIATLHKMLSDKRIVLSHDILAFVISALIGDHMILSTTAVGRMREEFDDILDARIRLIIKDYTPKRVSLGIRSFSRGAESMETDTEKMLCLLDKFSGRFINDKYDWNEDILTVVNKFLSDSVTQNEAYQLFLDTHSCVAFAAGRLFDTKMGVNIAPIQKTPSPVLWERDPLDESEYSTWGVRDERVSHDSFDTALIINITKDIYEGVSRYIEEESLSIGRIISCSIRETQSSKYAIANGTHCAQLSCSIDTVLNSRTTKERRAKLHIFSSAPNAFMFHLGQNSRGFGKSIILYEYDFEQSACCTYYPTIHI